MAHFLPSNPVNPINPRYLEYDAGLPKEFSYMFDNGMGLGLLGSTGNSFGQTSPILSPNCMTQTGYA